MPVLYHLYQRQWIHAHYVLLCQNVMPPAGVGTLQESLEVWKKAVADENALRKYARAMESSATEGWGNHKVCAALNGVLINNSERRGSPPHCIPERH